MAIRSGRFKSKDVSGAKKLTVVVATKDGAIYRFFNSGSNAYTIDDGTNTFPLEPTYSIDIGVNKSALNISTPVAKDVEGIYDILTTERSVRSGRFNVKASQNGPAPSHTVISLANNNKLDGTFYRFFNSGDEGDPLMPATVATFEIKGLSGLSNPLILSPGFSVDIEIKKGQTVTVEGINNGLAIEGIYEYLGS